MATKREVMLAGTPAKLAHMLASDNPNVLGPSGTDQGSAALIETNFQVLYGGTGSGVRLRPASGQFLHFLFNANFETVAVYPDGVEFINDSLPGNPFLLEPLMTAMFAPARQQWIAGQLAGSATGAPGGLIMLTANTTFYVAPGGVDAPGNGLSIVSPAATVGYIYSLLLNNYNLNGYQATIQLANGSYTQEAILLGVLQGQGAAAQLVIQGNVGSPNMVVWNGNTSCLAVGDGAMCFVQGITFQSPAGECILTNAYSRVNFQNCTFGATGDSHLVAARNSTIVAGGNYTISGGGKTHGKAIEGGIIIIESYTNDYQTITLGQPVVTITGTPAFSTAFLDADSLGLIACGAGFSGAATGVRSSAVMNGVINIHGQGASYLPGNAAGTTASGGQTV